MAQIREIKKRMVAVGTIQRITKTMQMIATAKFTAALQRAKATKPYTERIRQLVSEVSGAAGDVTHPLMTAPERKTNRELLVVISSDRGLCGAYNSNVLRRSMQQIRSMREAGTEVELHVIGKKAIAFFQFADVPIAQRYEFGDKPAFEDVEAAAQAIIDRFTAGEFDAVRVGYMKFISNARQSPEVMQLLPLQLESDDEGADESASVDHALYEFSPDGAALLADLLPRAMKVSLFQAVNDAVVSEQVMRMIAMKAATDNAADLGRSLKRDFNRARQGRITTELTEIVSGAAALE